MEYGLWRLCLEVFAVGQNAPAWTAVASSGRRGPTLVPNTSGDQLTDDLVSGLDRNPTPDPHQLSYRFPVDGIGLDAAALNPALLGHVSRVELEDLAPTRPSRRR
jgi:hypothetical protein